MDEATLALFEEQRARQQGLWAETGTLSRALGTAADAIAAAQDALVTVSDSQTALFELNGEIKAKVDALTRPVVNDPNAEPLGDTPQWKREILRDFRNHKAVPLGSAKTALSPMVFYDGNPIRDTDRDGFYDTMKTVSVVGGSTTSEGYLDIWMRHIAGQAYGAALLPMGWSARTSGRFSIRYFVEPVVDRKIACFLWPEPSAGFSGGDHRRGEANFFEGSMQGQIEAFLHSTAGDPNTNAKWAKTGVPMAGAWHTSTCEWTPEYIAYFLDGKEILRATKTENGHPKFPMRWIVQFESEMEAGAPRFGEGHVRLAWISVHSMASA
jgi:hypothetical protein